MRSALRSQRLQLEPPALQVLDCQRRSWIVDGEGSGCMGCRRNVEQPPARLNRSLRCNRNDRRRLRGVNNNFKGIERNVQAKAFTFEQGLLRGPAAKKRLQPLIPGVLSQRGSLSWSEVLLRNFGAHPAHDLNIDTQLVLLAESEQRDAAAMREIETYGSRSGIVRKMGLSMRSGGEHQALRRLLAPGRQDMPQRGVGADEMRRIGRTHKAPGTSRFLRAQDGPVPVKRRSVQIDGVHAYSVVTGGLRMLQHSPQEICHRTRCKRAGCVSVPATQWPREIFTSIFQYAGCRRLAPGA